MKFDIGKFDAYNGTTFKVQLNAGSWFLKFKNANDSYDVLNNDPIEIENEETYAKVMLGECDPCGDASTSVKNIFDGFSYDKVLVGGLGLGLLPEYLKTVKNCSVVDGVENNNELITLTNSNKHLNENINIIESDAYSYTPDKKYDLILIDLWWDKADITQQNETDLKNNYNSHLESNGKIVLPVAEKEL